MKNIEDINKANLEKIVSKRKIPEFFPGDTIRVGVRIVEGKRERIQNFEGICIARSNRGFNSTFTIRKISHGEGVERVFPVYSPMLESIELVRRAKLYYLRDREGKSARIAEKIKKNIGMEVDVKTSIPETPSQEEVSEKKITEKEEVKKSDKQK